MNFPFFIARRYLFSKKSTHAINVISAISVVGVAVATTALVVTLSVFNGFHDLVASLFTSFDPQLKVAPAVGKTVPADDPALARIKRLDGVEVATETLEDQALVVYGDRQAVVMIKGVEDNFDSLTHIREILVGDGEFELHAAGMSYGTPGIRLAETLGTGYRYDGPLKVYAPKREGQLNMANPADGFVEDELYSPGVLFSVQQAKYDKNYIITSIGFARSLFGQQGMIDTLDIDGGYVIGHQHDFVGMNLFAILPGQCFTVDHPTLQQPGDEGARPGEGVEYMHILVGERAAKLFLYDIGYGANDVIDHLDRGIDNAQLLDRER